MAPSMQQMLQQAIALHLRGQLAQAGALYEQILAADPAHFDALHLLGVVAVNQGDASRALSYFDQAIEIDGSNALAHFNRGTARQSLAQWSGALECYERALAIQPAFADAYSNRAVVLTQLRRWKAAIESCDAAIACASAHPQAHYNRGNVHLEMRNLQAALADYSRAIALRKDYPEAYFNRGNAHRKLGDWRRALEDFDRAIESRPAYASAHFNRGHVLRELKKIAPALASYRRAAELEPSLEFLPGELLAAELSVCDWQQGFGLRIESLPEQIARGEAVANPFVVLSVCGSASLQRQAAEIWVRESMATNTANLLAPHSPGQRLRIGYFSADAHEHATAHLIAGLLESHDRSRYEVTLFSFGPHSIDGMRQRLQAGCEHFHDVRAQSDDEVAALAHRMKIDIGVDLKGFTMDNRAGIFLQRAAPLQVNYLGYPGSMGAAFMDYIVADPVLVPRTAQHHYTEKMLYLPNSYQPNDARRPLAARLPSREQLGLPADAFVYCCFNNNYKITPNVFGRWMQILRQTKGSVLWLLQDHALCAKHLRREAQSHGVGPERLIFADRVPLTDHIVRHRAADLFLDTSPCGAHTTASDALWAGLPLLTCPGEAFASRVAASLLNAIGLPELVAETPEHYDRMAVQLATDRSLLGDLRRRLHINRATAPLFDIRRYTRNLERGYTLMHERSLAGNPPEHLYIEEGSPTFQGMPSAP